MLISFGKATMVVGLLALGSTLRGMPPQSMPYHGPSHPDSTQQVTTIRVSQESSPGAGDFDQNILGFIKVLKTTGKAADFYMYGKSFGGANYGNSVPVLSANTSHIFFVSAEDGLALFVVQNNSNHPENGNGGSARTQYEVSGGTASLLLADDGGEAVASDSGRMFTGTMDWTQSNTDGMVIGPLPAGFSIQGQFIAPPTGLGGGWDAISADSSKVSLNLVPGQRVRLDAKPTDKLKRRPRRTRSR